MVDIISSPMRVFPLLPPKKQINEGDKRRIETKSYIKLLGRTKITRNVVITGLTIIVKYDCVCFGCLTLHIIIALVKKKRNVKVSESRFIFYPGGRGSGAPALGACSLGLAPSVVTAVLLLLLPPPSAEAFPSPIAGGGEDDDEEVVMAGGPCGGELKVEEAAAAAAVPSVGLAEEEAGACVELSRVWGVSSGAVLGSGGAES